MDQWPDHCRALVGQECVYLVLELAAPRARLLDGVGKGPRFCPCSKLPTRHFLWSYSPVGFHMLLWMPGQERNFPKMGGGQSFWQLESSLLFRGLRLDKNAQDEEKAESKAVAEIRGGAPKEALTQSNSPVWLRCFFGPLTKCKWALQHKLAH